MNRTSSTRLMHFTLKSLVYDLGLRQLLTLAQAYDTLRTTMKKVIYDRRAQVELIGE